MPANHVKRAPGPWHYQEDADIYTHIIRGPKNEFIAQLPQDSSGRSEVHAREIVRACNSHQALLDALKEMRVALAGAMRVLAESGKTDEFLAVMKSLGVKDGVGVRATAAIALAQNPDCLCIVGCIVNDACPIHGDVAVSQADGEA